MAMKVLTQKTPIIPILGSLNITNFITGYSGVSPFIVLLCVLMYYCYEELDPVKRDEYNVLQKSTKTVCTMLE